MGAGLANNAKGIIIRLDIRQTIKAASPLGEEGCRDGGGRQYFGSARAKLWSRGWGWNALFTRFRFVNNFRLAAS